MSLTPSPPPPYINLEFELVIAHFNEDLTWLSPYSSHSTIYSKGTPPPFPPHFHRTITLLNIGRETHTYLTHIVRNYDSLSPFTLFVQGNIHDINQGTPAHTSLPLSEIVSQTTSLSDGDVLPIGLLHSFSDWHAIAYLPGWIQRRGKTLQRSSLTPAQFWKLIFANEHPDSVLFVQGALFGVTRGAIRRRSRAWYEGVLRYFEELGEVNPEEGHYMERFWYAVFEEAAVEKGKEVNGTM
jgi:Protein of unknown function (DUF3431)